MRDLRFAAAMALLAFAPSIAAAASSPSPATATSVTAGITSKSTFVVQAYITLPQSCYAARFEQILQTPHLHRHFSLLQVPPSSPCTGPQYKCTVVSPNYNLPIQMPFEVNTKDRVFEVHLSTHAPQPIEPLCRKG
jgi:hypothetical protein